VVSNVALAEPMPLRVSVNLSASGDPSDPRALHTSHIARGWPQTIVTDCACVGPIDPGGCWIKVNQAHDFETRGGPLWGKPMIGRYFSWRGNDNCDRFPAGCVTSDRWGFLARGFAATDTLVYNGRVYPNVNNLDVRNHFLTIARAELDRFYAPIVMHDNIVHRSADKTWPISWEATCQYLAGLRDDGRLILPNVAGPSVWWSWADLELFAASVDGVVREIGVHPKIRGDAEQLAKQIAADRYLLERGKWVVLLSNNGYLDKELADMNATKEQIAAAFALESRYTAAYCMMIRRSNEPCYAQHVYTLDAPDWEHWPEEFGEPLGNHTLNANGDMERYFENAVLRTKAPRTVEIIEVK